MILQLRLVADNLSVTVRVATDILSQLGWQQN